MNIITIDIDNAVKKLIEKMAILSHMDVPKIKHILTECAVPVPDSAITRAESIANVAEIKESATNKLMENEEFIVECAERIQSYVDYQTAKIKVENESLKERLEIVIDENWSLRNQKNTPF